MPASQVYVAGKGKKAAELGFHSVQKTLPATTTQAELLAVVEMLNADPAIHGILVQLPLPGHLDKTPVIEAIRPEKDVDGLHPINAGRLASGDHRAVVPCTPAGCMILLKRATDELAGKTAVVVGRSNLVGKPVAQLLLNENCTVTIAHSRTRDLAAVVRGADIVVAAVGRPELVRGDWIKPGAVVIDVGMNRIPAPERGEGKTRLVGDVAYAEAAAVAARDHAGAGRRRADDHRHADGQHADRGVPQHRASAASILIGKKERGPKPSLPKQATVGRLLRRASFRRRSNQRRRCLAHRYGLRGDALRRARPVTAVRGPEQPVWLLRVVRHVGGRDPTGCIAAEADHGRIEAGVVAVQRRMAACQHAVAGLRRELRQEGADGSGATAGPRNVDTERGHAGRIFRSGVVLHVECESRSGADERRDRKHCQGMEFHCFLLFKNTGCPARLGICG